MLAILDRASDGHRLMQVNLLLVWWIIAPKCSLVLPGAYLSTHTVYRYNKKLNHYFWGDMAILENGYRET